MAGFLHWQAVRFGGGTKRLVWSTAIKSKPSSQVREAAMPNAALPAYVARILQRFRDITETSNGWRVRCPVHDGHSLDIAIADDGRVLLNCKGEGCRAGVIVRTVGLTLADLFPPREESAKAPSQPPAKPKSEIPSKNGKPHKDWQAEARLKYTLCDDGKRAELASELGVSSESLEQLRVGRSGEMWTFPEREGSGRIIGIATRAPNGEKKCVYRSSRGITAPANLRELPDPVLVVEGASDTAALLTLGLTAVGRPSAGQGAKHLATMLRGRETLVIGENDQKNLVKWPGRDGARKVARELSRLWGQSVAWSLPPDTFKDVRTWLETQNIDPEDTERCHRAGGRLLEHFQSNSETAGVYHENDDGNGQRFIDQYGDRIRFVKEWRGWIVFNGQRWESDDTAAQRLAIKSARSIYQEASKSKDAEEAEQIARFAKASGRAERIAGLLKLAGPHVAINTADIDANPLLLNVANGTLDLNPGACNLRPHDPGDLLTRLIPIEYQPDATAPTWERFLQDVFNGDDELIGFIQRLAGYTLTGQVTEHCLPILWGTGRNGKSTLLTTLLAVWGNYGWTVESDMLLARRHESHPEERAQLFGRRLVVATETNDGRRLNEARTKLLTGGDPVVARFMYKGSFTFAPSHTIWLATNSKPAVAGNDLAIWSRLKLIPFRQRFVNNRRDPDMGSKLLDELPGILSWCVQGLRDYHERGLDEPDTVTAETREYRDDEDQIAQFVEETCHVSAKGKARSAFLLDQFRRFTGQLKFSPKRFKRLMEDHGYQHDRDMDGSYFAGIEPKGIIY